MSRRIETELMVGIAHNKKYVDKTIEFIDAMYPQGVESMMLEVAPNMSPEVFEFYSNRSFFKSLEDKYSSAGTRIIRGDPRQNWVTFGLNKGLRIANEIRGSKRRLSRLEEVQMSLSEVSKNTLATLDTLLFHFRDRKMIEVIEKEKPQVVVLGMAHTNYIKSKRPKIPYTALVFHESEFLKSLGVYPYNANNVVHMN